MEVVIVLAIATIPTPSMSVDKALELWPTKPLHYHPPQIATLRILSVVAVTLVAALFNSPQIPVDGVDLWACLKLSLLASAILISIRIRTRTRIKPVIL